MNNFQTLNNTGFIFLLSAPSGAGKSTLIKGLRSRIDCAYSISCTTRAIRGEEVDGGDYYFLSEEEFRRRIAAGDFLEYAEVHGKFYGTLKETVAAHLQAGRIVILDIDVAGAKQVRTCGDKFFTDALADVFIMPPSLDELRRRLESRGTETPEQIALRLRNAAEEMKHWRDYRYTMTTRNIEEDLAAILAIVTAERYLSCRQNF